MNCELCENVSTAYGRRKRAWLENGGDVPPGMIVDSACGDPHCFALAHIGVRPKIDIRITAKTHAFSFDSIEKLEIGQSIGVMVPEGADEEKFRQQLRSNLSTNRMFHHFRWSLRLRSDRVIAIRKMGRFSGGLEYSRARVKLSDVALANERPNEPARFCRAGLLARRSH